MQYDTSIYVNGREVALDQPTYFIADIASNHDGDLERAKDLIWQAKEAGADAAKFQHFKASQIVSDYGFKSLGDQIGHQSAWGESVYKVYEKYEFNRAWNTVLSDTALKAEIDFMTTPYDEEATREIAALVPAFKIGSGDITWTASIETVAEHGKPVFLATGAATMEDVERAVETVLPVNRKLVLMQCNTNYTGSLENFKHVNLRVLQQFAIRYPGMILGLSDHTPDHATVLGAIAFGARVVEKHFTDDNSRSGPDHAFSMNPKSWRTMIERSRELEAALGDGMKRVEANERDTVVIQRRALRLTRTMKRGELLTADCLEALRPAPSGAFEPFKKHLLIGQRLVTDKTAGDALFAQDVERCDA